MVSIRRLQSVESEDESAWESLDLNNDTNSREPSRHDHHQQRPQQQQQQQERTQTYHESDPSALPTLADETPSPTISSPSLVEITSPAMSNSHNNGTSGSNRRRATPEPMLDASCSSSVLLKESLVHHPMNLFWSHFLLHFTQELWKLDVHIRLALALITLGAVVKLLLCLTWFVWNPRTCLTILLGLGPFLYFQRHAIQRRWQQIAAAVDSSSPEVLLETALGRLEPAQLRRFMFFILFVPTLLEARTIVFLSSIKLDPADSWSTIYNVTIATALAVGACYYGGFFAQEQQHQHSPRFLAPRECLQRALLFLYASALCVSLICLDLWRLPHLIAPFCLASGVLILAWHDDGDNGGGDSTSGKNGWFANCVRQALRLTVRDILTTITDSVCQDQMLQLAMLRWVVEYWSTSTSTASTPPGAPRSRTARNTATPPSSSSSSTTHATSSTHHDEGLRNTATAEQRQQLQWDELWPMLTTTTDQMAGEVRSLHGVGSNTTSSATSDANAYHGARNNSTTSDPVRDLQSLLASLDLDERAKPAVMAYKRGVHDFPPERNWSIAFALIHRCPAILALVWQVYYYWTLEWRGTLLLLRPWSVTCSAMLIRLPLVALELLRIHTWVCSCQAAAAAASSSSNLTKGDEDYAACLQVLDSMTILLSGDDYNPRRPPALLRVWRNVTDSVEALEVGIVTTRCLQTTAVAAEFAENVRSLLQFGAEVQEYGWVHGIAVAFKEVILYHQQQNHNADADASRITTSVATVQPRAKYANAAVGAFRNSQRLRRNLEVLTQDEDVTKLGAPLVAALSVITGYGWLWGRSNEGQRIEEADSSKKTGETPGNDITVAKNCDTAADSSLEQQSESTDSEPHALPLVQPIKETQIGSDLLTTTGVALTTTAAVAAAMAMKYNICSPNDITTQTDNHDISSPTPAKKDEIVLPSLPSSSSIRAATNSLPENIDDSPTVSSDSAQEKEDSAVPVATTNCITAAVAASAAEIDGFHRTNDDDSKSGNNILSNFNSSRESSKFSSPILSTKTDEASEPHERSQANEGVTADPIAKKEEVDEDSSTMSPKSVEDVKQSTSSVGPANSLHGGAASPDAATNDSSMQVEDIGDNTSNVLEIIAVCDKFDTLDQDVICEKRIVENSSNVLLDESGCPPQGPLEISNASTRALVVKDRSPRQESPLLDFTGSLRQKLIVDQGGTAPNYFPPADSDDEWEGLEPDPFECDTPLTENSMIQDKPSKPEKDKQVGDQGGQNLFLSLAAVGAAAIGVAAVAFAGQNKSNNDKDDNRQAQRSRSNPTS